MAEQSTIVTPAAHGIVIRVRVIPRASRSAIAGVRDEALLVRLKAPPVDGAANDELVALLARVLDVPRRSISLLSGERDRLKRVAVTGVTADVALLRIFGDAGVE